MSPSRRRAIGAVRGLASRTFAVPPRHRGARLGIVCVVVRHGGAPRSEALRVPRRRALRGYRGAHGDAPGKTLNVCYLPFPTRITRAARWGHRALPPLHPRGVRRHYPRALRRLCAPWSCPVVRSRCGRARCPHRAAAPWRGARLGLPLPYPAPTSVPHSCPAKFARALPDTARCLAAGPPGSRPTAITHRKIRTRWLT